MNDHRDKMAEALVKEQLGQTPVRFINPRLTGDGSTATFTVSRITTALKPVPEQGVDKRHWYKAMGHIIAEYLKRLTPAAQAILPGWDPCSPDWGGLMNRVAGLANRTVGDLKHNGLPDLVAAAEAAQEAGPVSGAAGRKDGEAEEANYPMAEVRRLAGLSSTTLAKYGKAAIGESRWPSRGQRNYRMSEPDVLRVLEHMSEQASTKATRDTCRRSVRALRNGEKITKKSQDHR